MFKTIRKYFEMQARMESVDRHMGIATVTCNTSPSAKAGRWRVEILEAVNGKILEIAHRKSPQHDWEFTLYMVRDDESMADAIATALCVTGGA